MVRLIFASLLAGTLGGVITYSVLALFATGRIPFLRDFFEHASIPPVVIERRAEIILRQEEALADAIKKVESSLGEIVLRPLSLRGAMATKQSPEIATPRRDVGARDDRLVLAPALAVTDDGWLVTRETNLPSANQLAVRDREGRIIPVVDIKKDEWAHLTFLKLKETGEFRAATFPDKSLELGTFLAAVRSDAGELEVYPTYITTTHVIASVLPAGRQEVKQSQNPRAMTESTELLTRISHLRDELPARFKNNFAIRLDGTIAGVINGNILISARILAARLDLFLRGEQLMPPGLGFNYRDLTEVTVTQVTPAGLAAKAGLKAGDRLIAINNTPLARDTVFAEMLAGLSRKKSVTLRIERGTDSINIEINPRN